MIIRTIILLLTIICQTSAEQIIICFVLDQCSYDTLIALKPHLTGGIKFLFDHGIVYHNAYWPHAIPSTSSGHAGLSTGCLPKDHGIIDNNWVDKLGNKVAADDAPVETAAVFSPDGLYDFGKSAQHMMVDSLADQLLLQSKPSHKNCVYSIAYKDRASIMMAGQMGKAFWIDDFTGNVTTSKAYFGSPPKIVENFNNTHIQHKYSFTWTPIVKDDQNLNQNNYARLPSPFNRIITIADQKDAELYFELYRQTPDSQTLVLEFAKQLLENAIAENNQTILLYVGLSATDKVGHIYGPNSIEYKDILLQTDTLIQSFIDYVQTIVAPENIIYILTADHGSMPIAEQLNTKGLTLAKRINTKEIKKNLNIYIEKKYAVADIITYIDTPSIYLNKKQLQNIPGSKQKKIITSIKQWVKRQPGIKQVWTFSELKNKCITTSIEQLFKNHLFEGRSADLFFLVYPYVYASKNKTGTGHKSPYNYDTHVPLIMLQPATLQEKNIYRKVWVQQAVPTLAQLCNIPKPSACTFGALPGIN